MHGKSRPLFATALACLLFGGCASVPQQKLDARADLKSKTVVVMPVGIPKDATVNLISSSADSFGLVGGLIEGGILAKHVKDLAGLLESQKFDFHAEVSDEVVQTAQKSAAKIVVVDSTNVGAERTKWVSPVPVTSGADAYLDVYLATFGYVAKGDQFPYVPSVDLWARITDASGKQLFLTHILYNPDLDNIRKSQGPKITPDAQYQFASMDAIKANPEKAVAGLKAAISVVIRELSDELQQTASVAQVN